MTPREADVESVRAVHARTPETFGPAAFPDQPHLFSVTTWGLLGQFPLARVLNGHADVFCVEDWRASLGRLSPRIALGPVDYAALLMRAGEGHAAAGDVDGLTREESLELRATFGPAYASVSVIRDPSATLAEARDRLDVLLRTPDLARVDATLQRRIDDGDVNLPDDRAETCAFARAANLLNMVNWAPTVGPVFTLEALSSGRSLAGLVAYVTAGRVVPEPAWIDAASSGLALHEPSVVEYEQWEREVLEAVVLSWTSNLYRSFGYRMPGQT